MDSCGVGFGGKVIWWEGVEDNELAGFMCKVLTETRIDSFESV